MSNKDTEEVLVELHAEVEKGGSAVLASRRKMSQVTLAKCKNAQYMPPTVLDAIETIVENKSANKYLFSILVACCVKKIIDPSQDTRIAQDNMPGGYSNRSFDQRHVTPFLKRHGYTHCEASGLESGRNFERPLAWDLEYPANPRGKGNREAFLGILNYIEAEKGDPKAVALCLLSHDLSKQHQAGKRVVPPRETQIARIMHIFERHFEESSGQGKSRLPVLALYAIYDRLVAELDRYDGTELVPLERHTTADLRSGSIGDIQVNRQGGPFEGVEVKSEKPITAAMVRELPRKFDGRVVSRYYLLSTCRPYILEEDEESVAKTIQEVERETGTQIIVNGLLRTLWYYLRLLKDPAAILPIYQVLLEADEDIRLELKNVWNKIILEEYPRDRTA